MDQQQTLMDQQQTLKLILYCRPLLLCLSLILAACGGGDDGSSDPQPQASLSLEKRINGQNASAEPGPDVTVGDTVEWQYTLTNTGDVVINNVFIDDNTLQPLADKTITIIVCEQGSLAPGATLACSRDHVVTYGQHQSQATARGIAAEGTTVEVTSDTYYRGVEQPALTLEKRIDDQASATAPGAEWDVQSIVTWSYHFTNTGDVPLRAIQVRDTTLKPSPLDTVGVCEVESLAVGESQHCQRTHVIAAGEHHSQARIEALSAGNNPVSATSDSYYHGINPIPLAALPSANLTRGDTPLAVIFTPGANTGNAIIRYEWDFEGDGTFDRSETVGRDQSFIYNTPGNYKATLRVTDNQGEQATGTVVISVVNEPPVVSVNLNPSNGQTPLTVNFSATATDSDGIAQFEWDYNGDGTFDASTTSATTANTYNTAGTFQARLRVTDNLGAATTLTMPTVEVSRPPVISLSLEKRSNGQNTGAEPGPDFTVGGAVEWQYTLTNTGDVLINNVFIDDNTLQPLADTASTLRVCEQNSLAPGATLVCSHDHIVTYGQHQSRAIARGTAAEGTTVEVSSDTYYRGVEQPALTLEKRIDDQASLTAPGAEWDMQSIVTWSYHFTNTGDVPLRAIQVTDTTLKPSALDTVGVCEVESLAVGESQHCQRTHFIVEGEHQSQARIDALSAGNNPVSATSDSYYQGINPNQLTALPSANLTSGDAPLAVIFTPDANTGNAIIRYEWDFEGDGNFDRSETVGRDQSFTYNTPGNYNATLRVTDSQGEQVTGTVMISVDNEAPVVSVNLNPSNGQIPLTVNFSATATDSDGIAQFEWDYNGDGIFDASTTSGTTANTYNTAGTFQARLRVTDNLGAATTFTIPTLEVKALTVGSPSVTLTSSANQGNPPLTVTLYASATDPDGGTIDQYEWDVEGDGTYDQTTTTTTLQTTYNSIGTFYPRVRVTDSDNQQADDTTQISVEPQLSLSLSTDTIDPGNAETATVTTTLGGEAEVSIVIEDRSGQQVRTLVPFSTRAAGNYADVWDGNNDAGTVVTEGDYRAILLYRIDGIVERLDLALTTGGIQSNPPRSRIPRTFSPLAGDPLDITFTLNRASEVTAFMGLYYVNTRLVTFLQRQPLGRGSHVVTWNGENADGKLIEAPGNDRFLFGIFAYTLPDNAIYVRSGVHVSTVSASPSIFQPTQQTVDGSPSVSSIDVGLNRSGDVRLTINDTDSGMTIAEFDYTGLDAGINTITWDGRTNDGNYVAPGTYRLGVAGVDSTGYQSLTVYALQRVFY